MAKIKFIKPCDQPSVATPQKGIMVMAKKKTAKKVAKKKVVKKM